MIINLSGKVGESCPTAATAHLLLLLLLFVLPLALFLVGLAQLLDALLEPVPVRLAGHTQLLEDGAVQLQQLLSANLHTKGHFVHKLL